MLLLLVVAGLCRPVFAYDAIVMFSNQMELLREKNGWRVKVIDSEAKSYSMLRDGDLIRMINHRPSVGIGLLAIRDTVNEATVIPVDMTVQRQNHDLHLKFFRGKGDISQSNGLKPNMKVSFSLKAPTFVLPDVHGKQISLASYKDHWVLINFWGTWCGDCIIEMPELASLTNTHKDKLVVLGLSIMDKDAKLQSFLQKHPLPYTIINSGTATSAVPLEYGVATPDGSYSAPVSVLIKPGGEIVYVQEGSSDKQTLLLDQVNLFLNPRS